MDILEIFFMKMKQIFSEQDLDYADRSFVAFLRYGAAPDDPDVTLVVEERYGRDWAA